MEEPRKEKSSWPVAVAASLGLHAAVLAGLELLPLSPIKDAAGGPCDVTMASGSDRGELHLLQVVGLASDVGPQSGDRPGLAIWPSAPTEDPHVINVALSEPSAGGSSSGAAGVAKEFAAGKPGGNTSGSAARRGTTTFFQVPAHGRRIVYVLDASMSMGKDGALKVAREELLQSIRSLPSDVEFQVIVYNTRPRLLNPKWEFKLQPMLRANREAIEEVAAGLAALNAEGGTDHGPALQRALALRPDVIFLLTDADDLKQDHLSLVSRLNQGKAVIHTIELSPHNRHRPGMPLQRLASENRGQYQAVDLRQR